MSDRVQKMYESAERRHDTDWLEVTEELQRELVRGVGIPECRMEEALRQLRAAPHQYPELKPLCVYHRQQRAKACPLAVGEQLPRDLGLMWQFDGSQGDVPREGTVLVVAGSYS